MKNLLIVATSTLFVLTVIAVPLPSATNDDVKIVQIPLDGNKELDILSLPENASGQLSDRSKRTIGVLRQLFPELSKKVEQMIEEKIQIILPIILRNVGPLLLRGGLGGLSGGGGGGGTTNNNDDDDFDDDDDDTNTSVKAGEDGSKVSVSLPTFPPDTDEDEDDEDNSGAGAPAADGSNTNANEDGNSTNSGSTSTSSSSSSSSSDAENNVDSNANVINPTSDQPNMTSNGNPVNLAELSERLDTIRVARQAAATAKAPSSPAAQSSSDATDSNTIATAISDDTNVAASENNDAKSPAIDELSLDDEATTDEDRNKRFLNFGFGSSSGNGGGSGGSGGSGSFLFDIIRRTMDRAARAAGTIYRVAAGTESLDIGTTNKQATRSTDDDTDNIHNDNTDTTSRKTASGYSFNGLIGGSAGTEQQDERENAPVDGSDGTAGKAGGDGYTEAIPGPVTRLFVLANRGLANLIQDLILRIAQTSERVVNFKARLVTSLI